MKDDIELIWEAYAEPNIDAIIKSVSVWVNHPSQCDAADIANIIEGAKIFPYEGEMFRVMGYEWNNKTTQLPSDEELIQHFLNHQYKKSIASWAQTLEKVLEFEAICDDQGDTFELEDEDANTMTSVYLRQKGIGLDVVKVWEFIQAHRKYAENAAIPALIKRAAGVAEVIAPYSSSITVAHKHSQTVDDDYDDEEDYDD